MATDPLHDADELRALGFEPWEGEAVAAAVLQADHRQFTELAPRDLPGLRVLVDGRGTLDPETWRAGGVSFRRIGRG